MLLAVCACALPVSAISLDEIDANASLMLIGSVPPAGYGGPSPIVQLLGASLPISLSSWFVLEPMLELFGTDYEWTDTFATAVPAAVESGGGFFTLGTLISLHAGVRLPIAKAVSLGLSIGPDFLLRFPLEFFNNLPASVAGRAPAQAYFFADGRFFYPESRLFFRWQFSESLVMVINLRVFYPLFHAWDGLGQPFIDQFMVSAGLGLGFRLGVSPSVTAPVPAVR